MFGHQNSKENFSDLHTILEAQMILESLHDEQADNVAKQITELLSLLSSKAASKSVNSSQHVAKTETTTPQNSFAERLKLALDYTEASQSALAWAIGVSQSTISSYVTGKVKKAGVIRSADMARALGVNVEWLIYGRGEMLPAKNLTKDSEV